MFGIDNPWALPIAGLGVGIVMGYVARRHHFCTMSALERHWYAGDGNGLRAWALAAATALVATQLLIAAEIVDVSESFYLTENLPVAGALIGGLMFGFGMALVGTCGFGALIRLGGGSLRAFIVLGTMAMAAMAAQRGVVAHLRSAAIDPLSVDLTPHGGQSLGALASTLTDIDLTLLLAAALLYWIFKDSGFRRDTGKIVAGTVIGLCIAAGWYATASFSETLFTRSRSRPVPSSRRWPTRCCS